MPGKLGSLGAGGRGGGDVMRVAVRAARDHEQPCPLPPRVRVEQRVHDAAIDVVVTTVENMQDTTIFFRSPHLLSEQQQRDVRRERCRYHELFCEMIRAG
ncbi:MAG: hypothetical protein L0H84_12820 [Pseudonocardia sp.]|nr:hypothetical protein [Pseudonocardia sp.]